MCGANGSEKRPENSDLKPDVSEQKGTEQNKTEGQTF